MRPHQPKVAHPCQSPQKSSPEESLISDLTRVGMVRICSSSAVAVLPDDGGEVDVHDRSARVCAADLVEPDRCEHGRGASKER